MIEVRDLVKEYGGRLAVDHLSFTVPDGQIFGFLRPNGGWAICLNGPLLYMDMTVDEYLRFAVQLKKCLKVSGWPK